MATEPLISIITISWNAGKVIGRTIKSIAEQTFGDYEHIVIDGKSTDNTLDIVMELSRKKPIVISEPDKGIYDAMNKGLRIASGKYVIFMNAGDSFLDCRTLEKYAMEAGKNKYDIIYGDTVIVNDAGDIICPRHLSAPQALTPRSYLNGMLVCHQSFMVRKSIAPQYDTAYKFSADYLWCLSCIKNTKADKCRNLNSVVTKYLAEGTTDKNMKSSLKERFHIMCDQFGMLMTVTVHLKFAIRFLIRKISQKKK